MNLRASSFQQRWPKLLIGAVLPWRTLCVVAIANSVDPVDSRVLGELSSPGLSRSVKLVFASDEATTRKGRSR